MIDKAIMFSASAHKGMYRKGNHQPYIFHPLEVLSLVSMMSDDDEILCAAVLHDTVEDTPATIEDIKNEFGERVAKLVGSESEDKRGQVNKAATWVDRKKESIEEVKNNKDIGSKMICLADKVSNLRSFHLLKLQEGDKMWDNFNMKDPKKHYWYYSEIAEALIELKENAVYKELIFLIETIFNEYIKENEDE